MNLRIPRLPPLDHPLLGLPVATYDLETTSADPEVAEVVQVAIVHSTLEPGGGNPIPALNLLLDPGIPIPPGATAVHGITDAMVKGKPHLSEVLPAVKAAMDQRMMMAYNLPYDWTILERYWPEIPFIGLDPLPWSRVALRYLKRHRLGGVCAHYGVALDGAHDAVFDTLATAHLAPKVLHDLCLSPSCGIAPMASAEAMWRWTVQAALHEEKWHGKWRESRGWKAYPPTWARLVEVHGLGPVER